MKNFTVPLGIVSGRSLRGHHLTQQRRGALLIGPISAW
jgi:hypothetical protein